MDPRIRKAIVNDMIESIPQSVKLQVRQEVAERVALELQIRSIKLLADTQAFSNWLKKPRRGEPGEDLNNQETRPWTSREVHGIMIPLSSKSTIVRPLTHASALSPQRDNDQEQQ